MQAISCVCLHCYHQQLLFTVISRDVFFVSKGHRKPETYRILWTDPMPIAAMQCFKNKAPENTGFSGLYDLLLISTVKSYTLDRYSPVLVSILILSPWFTNRGTFTCAPVSTVAGFVAPWAVSPLNPGSVSVISSSTNRGGSIANTLPL